MALFEHSYAGPTGRKKATDSLLISQEQQSTARMWATVMMVISLAVSFLSIVQPYSSPWPWPISTAMIVFGGFTACAYINDAALRNDYPFYHLAATLVNAIGVLAIAGLLYTRLLVPRYDLNSSYQYVVFMMIVSAIVALATYWYIKRHNR